MGAEMDLVIYGAQGMALGAYEAISNLYPQRKIRCFLVTERDINAGTVLGVPVDTLDAFADGLSQEEKNEIEVLIATPENVMPEIEKRLEERGLRAHVRLTSVRWANLMSYHYACDKNYLPLAALPVGYHRANLHVLMAKFYKDKPLSAPYRVPDWITPIQVGAALCEERVADLVDCDGENISEKNKNYSELTALYWMWKNKLSEKSVADGGDYYGLVHYRRILDLSQDDVFRLTDNGVDAVLPYPMPYEPNIESHHMRYLKEEDWNAVLSALEELQPQYAQKFPAVLGQRYLYNYNIVVARQSVLEEYCSWLFPILERVEQIAPDGANRADRYIGYVAETLATLYFMVNRDVLRIVHAGCRFLV